MVSPEALPEAPPEASPEASPEAARPFETLSNSPESPGEAKDGLPMNTNTKERSSLQLVRGLRLVSGRLSADGEGADHVPREMTSPSLHPACGLSVAEQAPSETASALPSPSPLMTPQIAPAPTSSPIAPVALFEGPVQADGEAEAEASTRGMPPQVSVQGASEGLGQASSAQEPTPQGPADDSRSDAVEQREQQHATAAPKPLPVVGELVDGVVTGIGGKGVFVDIGCPKVATLTTKGKDALRPGQQLFRMRVEKVAPKLGLVKLVLDEDRAGMDAADASQQPAPEVAGGQQEEGVVGCGSRSSTPSLRNRLVRAGFLAESSASGLPDLSKPSEEEPQEPERSPERRHQEPEVELCVYGAAPCNRGVANQIGGTADVPSEVAAAATPTRALLGAAIQSPLRKSDACQGSPGSQTKAQQPQPTTPPRARLSVTPSPQKLSPAPNNKALTPDLQPCATGE